MLYEVEIWYCWKDGFCLWENKFYKSDKPLNKKIKDCKVIKKKDYTLIRNIIRYEKRNY